MAYELLGFDVLIDDDFNVFILEVNHTPSLAPHTAMENRVKREMLDKLFHLMDVAYEDGPGIKDEIDRRCTEYGIDAEQTVCPWNENLDINTKHLSRYDVEALVTSEYQVGLMVSILTLA